MRLFEHPDFDQAMLRAAAQFDVSEQFVEKDYYVTEVLRVIAEKLGGRAMFKGGTSLSKGWGLIKRFSEDIDLFVNPELFEPRPGRRAIDRILKDLARDVGDHPALTWVRDESLTIGGRSREDYFSYETRFGELPGIRAAVRLEPGVQSGTFLTEVVSITSLVGDYLHDQGESDIAEDLIAFDMALLHYRRTFVEKMFALHGKVARLLEQGKPLGRDARHYPDLYVLSGQPEVLSMLASAEYGEIRRDYDATSSKFFGKSYRPPPGLSFVDSPAFFPPPELKEMLRVEYNAQCQLLFSSTEYPTFNDVLGRFAEIRTLL